jgi:hypothetical protein
MQENLERNLERNLFDFDLIDGDQGGWGGDYMPYEPSEPSEPIQPPIPYISHIPDIFRMISDAVEDYIHNKTDQDFLDNFKDKLILEIKSEIYPRIIRFFLNSVKQTKNQRDASLKTEFLYTQINEFLKEKFVDEHILKEIKELINFPYFMHILLNEWSLYMSKEIGTLDKKCLFADDENKNLKKFLSNDHYYLFVNSKNEESYCYSRYELEDKVIDFMNWLFWCRDPIPNREHEPSSISPIFIKIIVHPSTTNSMISLSNIFSILNSEKRIFYIVEPTNIQVSRTLKTATYQNFNLRIKNINTNNCEPVSSQCIAYNIKECRNKPSPPSKKSKGIKKNKNFN